MRLRYAFGVISEQHGEPIGLGVGPGPGRTYFFDLPWPGGEDTPVSVPIDRMAQDATDAAIARAVPAAERAIPELKEAITLPIKGLYVASALTLLAAGLILWKVR